MSERYPGGFITKDTPAPSGPYGTNTASGIWTLEQQAQYQSAGNWPVVGGPFDPNFENVTLLLHGDGTNGGQNNTFLDSSTNNFTITRNGNTTQGSFSPYGPNWSNYFDGTGDYLTAPSNAAFAFGTGDFTVEAWVYVAASKAQVIADTRNSGPSASGIAFAVDSSNFPYVYVNSATLFTSSTALSLNTWTHLAFVKSSGTITLYINGVKPTTGSAASATSCTDTSMTIGTAVDFRDTTATLHFIGYTSNLRIVKGTAVYTANFTPSTTPLTAVSGTSLLTCQSNRFIDNSTNNFAITRFGDVSVQRFSPFAPPAAYSTATIGGSGYFDGAGDYLSLSTTSIGNFGTGDFTVEYWIAPITQGQLNHLDFRGTGGTGGAFRIGMVSAGFKITAGWDSTDTQLVSTTTPNPSSWTHVAVTRSGTTCRMFINGAQEASVTSGYSFPDNGLLIATYTGSTAYYNGYMSSIRVVKGTAVYTATFTPPTAPLTAVTNTSLLTNFTNAAIFDNAMMNDLETVGNAQISTSVVKYGTGSMSFDGTGDYLKNVTTSLASLEGNFTIECWLYYTAHGSYGGIVSCANSNTSVAPTSGWAFVFYSTTNRLYFETGAGFSLQTTNTIPTSQWNHVAVVRSGSTITHYLNGVANGSGTSSAAFNVLSTDNFVIGVDRGLSSTMTGYIDDLRITKGVARYTATFTPPTAAFPNQ